MAKQESRFEGAASDEELIQEDPAEGGAPAEAKGAEHLLEMVLAEQSERAAREARAALPSRIEGVMIGKLEALSDQGEPLVTFLGAPLGGAPARSTVALNEEDIGREVALLFEGGDPARPLIMGRMFTQSAPSKTPEASVDGERVLLSAEREIVLRCGKASITLTKEGKIILRGTYLLARSSGVNRIQGGSVQIN